MRKRTHKTSDFHSDWLSQVDIDGPFLAYPVLKDMWPNGVDRLGDTDDRLITFKQAFAQWQRAFDQYVEQPKTPEAKSAYDAVRRAWIDVVLSDIAEWGNHRTDADITVRSPGEQITVTATGALNGRDGNPAALLLICEPTSGLRDAGLDGWAANDIDRLAMLLRKAQIEVGIVTDGQWWALVWAKDGKPTGSGMVNALTWAEEPLLRDAFFTLINQRRFRASDPEQRLSRLFERSELEAEEITEALGTQVRRSVELLVQAFSEARLEAAKAGDPDPLTEKPDDIYQAAVTVMMRIVFLLFAEERDMLPTEQLYWDSYAIKDLLDDLRAQAAGGEEHLDETYDAWHRLLAVSQALHGGVNYDEMRMPAYGGSLLDPDRFPWLHTTDSRGLRLKVSDRVMLHVLESVQTVVAKGERRRISFREIDVEQIGYIYEGLLGYSCAEVTDDIILGLVGKDGAEPEIPLSTINDLYDEHGGDSKKFAAALVAWIKENQPAATGKTAAALTKLVDQEPSGDDRAELVRLLSPVAAGDEDLLENLVGWGKLIRRDLRNIPLVFPVGGLVVVETPSRKNAGAHYTPRSLAEEVVLHALQPLVYEPGPLQTNDENEWRLKSSAAILDLKVADIAAGSGAFLVAAARYLSERLVEAWVAEGMLDGAAAADPEELRRQALREVIARCLYGADINPMAVEMCKLSLWLVSMDKTKPFSFVDDKVFCGNSLLGLTSLDQLRYIHIAPEPSTMQQQLLVDIDTKIATAMQLRHELASPVDEHDPMRSSRAKTRLLEQLHDATAELRLMADGIVAAGLPLGGKTGRPLDDAFKTLSWQLQEAFPADGESGDASKLIERIDSGLAPTVATDYVKWQPLHWVLEAPDVLVEHGGFDAVLGNPPFLYGREIASAVGANLRSAFIQWLADGVAGVADLCVYFMRRGVELLRDPHGMLGIVATNTITQGPSRLVGLDALLSGGAQVRRSVRSTPWPTKSAALDISLVWLVKQAVEAAPPASADGELVPRIASTLEPVGRVSGDPVPLAEARGGAFKGSNLNGLGFLMTPEEARRMLVEDPENAEVLHAYLTGDDLNGRPDQAASRWTVDFRDMAFEKVKQYEAPYAWIRANLYDYRQTLHKKPRLQERWWVYESRAKGLYDAISGRQEVIAVSAVTKHLVPSRVSSDAIFSHGVIVFCDASPGRYAVLSSEAHVLWAWTHGSNLETRLNYNIKSCFDAFPMPDISPDLISLGEALHVRRSEILSSRGIGITSLYNLVCDPNVDAGDIVALRDLHIDIDREVVDCYGWDDLILAHGFHTYKRVERWTLAPEVRSELLDRLLAENHRRAKAEGMDVPTQSSSSGQDTLFA